MDYRKEKKSVSKPSIYNILIKSVTVKWFKCPLLYLELLKKVPFLKTQIIIQMPNPYFLHMIYFLSSGANLPLRSQQTWWRRDMWKMTRIQWDRAEAQRRGCPWVYRERYKRPYLRKSSKALAGGHASVIWK